MSLQPAKEPEGVLLIDKPQGITSHDVVDRVRRILRMKRIGHAGTLDPMATGLLIILVGKATRLSQYLTTEDKVYEGQIEFGKTTNSQDADGEVVESRPLPADFSKEKIAAAMRTFLGDQYQTPPMFSAIKIGGTPLYKLARKGEEVAREPRFIRVSSFDLLDCELPRARFRVHCTKGTYVRTLAHDLGNKLGCGAHLCALRRTRSGALTIERAITLEQLEQLGPGGVGPKLVPTHEAAPSHAL